MEDESLVAGLKNDEKDRHVVAAAVKAGAQVTCWRTAATRSGATRARPRSGCHRRR